MPVADRVLDEEQKKAFDAAYAELIASEKLNGERVGAHTNLGTILMERGDLKGAEEAYRTAGAIPEVRKMS